MIKTKIQSDKEHEDFGQQVGEAVVENLRKITSQ